MRIYWKNLPDDDMEEVIEVVRDLIALGENTEDQVYDRLNAWLEDRG